MTLEESVIEGAKLLDKLVPGWHKRLNLEKLEMININMCVLGQLFGLDVETSVAKTMFPELFVEAWTNRGSGYGAGKIVVAKLCGFTGEEDPAIDKNPELTALYAACSGFDTKCYWAEEVAKRIEVDIDNDGRIADENSN